MPLAPVEQTHALLVALAHNSGGTRRDAYLAVTWREPDTGYWRSAHPHTSSNLRAAANRVQSLAELGDVYIGTQLYRHVPASGRGGKRDVSGLAAVLVDIDMPTPLRGRTTLPLPPTEADALSILAPFRAPTLLTRTAAGLQALWLLDRHAALDTAEAEWLSVGWVAAVAAHATSLGWHLDRTGDLARVGRMPGTRNHKYAGAPPVTIAATGPRITLDDIRAVVPAPPPRPPRMPLLVGAAGDESDLQGALDRALASVTFAQMLQPHGWSESRQHGDGSTYWTRPGKSLGTSAVSHDEPDRYLWVFSSSTTLPCGYGLSPLQVIAHLDHGGDIRAAIDSVLPGWRETRRAAKRAEHQAAKVARDATRLGGLPASQIGSALSREIKRLPGGPDRRAHADTLIAAAVRGGLSRGTAALIGARALQPIEAAR